jgi:hypothetical protein
MALTATIIFIAVLDCAVLGALAYVMLIPRRFRRHAADAAAAAPDDQLLAWRRAA